ncbi:hypothetical protein [Halorubrum sp. DTA46]|uniref:hypothetical protein n=1 Tax=Halorubrum sp. DTA46 TaxID=3402162 RepID=UPI003AAED4C8
MYVQYNIVVGPSARGCDSLPIEERPTTANDEYHADMTIRTTADALGRLSDHVTAGLVSNDYDPTVGIASLRDLLPIVAER